MEILNITKQTKQIVKRLVFTSILSLMITSCNNDDSTNPDDDMISLDLIAIKSTNMPSGNSCNVWDLIKAPSLVFPSFSTLDVATIVDDVDAEYLGQTTMNYQSSAYDKLNKKYVVSTNERVVVYDTDSNSIDIIIDEMGIMAMEFVDGVLYVIKNNNIHTMSLAGVISPVIESIISSGSPSNMAFYGNQIYFIQNGRLFKFNITSEILSQVLVTTENVTYSGVEYHLGKIYATKRYFSDTEDDFVRIDVATGWEEILFSLADSYTKDYSRISSALDYNTGIYYLAASNGHSSDQHTITTMDINDVVPTPTSESTADNKYVFGLQLKD